MGVPTAPRPLAENDDRTGFDCGRESINVWFRRHAWANHSSGTSRVNVIADIETGKVAGFVTLSSSQIERAFLPKAQQRNQPDPMPVTLLGQLAIDKRYQGQGYATSLLLFALKTALRVGESVGTIGVITHPLDDELRRFYAKRGFQDLPFDPRRTMIVRMSDLSNSFSTD